MSLLSKLLSGKKPTLSDVAELFQGKEEKQKPAAAQARPAARPEPGYEPYVEETPLGRSWGKKMPNEPNQFNYPGTYIQYFESIFHTEFAAYRVLRSENPRSSKVTIYTFYAGDRVALVVELASQSCCVYKLGMDCAKAGIPHLRFYYDHEGWWNARSYVVARISKALNG